MYVEVTKCESRSGRGGEDKVWWYRTCVVGPALGTERVDNGETSHSGVKKPIKGEEVKRWRGLRGLCIDFTDAGHFAGGEP